MKDSGGNKVRSFSRHVLDCRYHSCKLPKEIIEIQDMIKRLSCYTERFKELRPTKEVKCGVKEEKKKEDKLEEENEEHAEVVERVEIPEDEEEPGDEEKPEDEEKVEEEEKPDEEKPEAETSSSRTIEGKSIEPLDGSMEVSYSATEETTEAKTAEVIEEPRENVSVISEKKSLDEDEESVNAYATPVGEMCEDESRYEDAIGFRASEIGIYFIEEVSTVRLVNVIQRELGVLKKICPGVACIVCEICKEFDHFKVCCSCLKKVAPVLPDILKELQELIKFIKKRRNEVYTWPDDSEYLRKDQPRKQDCRSATRKETVGYVSVHPKSPLLIREVQRRVRRKLTAHGKKILDKPLTRPVTQTGSLKKLRFVDDLSPLLEYSTCQHLVILQPEPILETALQLRIEETIQRFPEEGDHVSATTLLLTANSILSKVCIDLDKMDYDKDVRSEVKELKTLMLEVHRNQIELSKLLLEKGVLSPAMVQLTDPQMLFEEREGILRARNTLIAAGSRLDTPKTAELQRMVDELKRKCQMKNRMIVALVKGLRSNVPRQHWEDLINFMLKESDSIQDLGVEKINEFIRKSSMAMSIPGKTVRKCQERKPGTRKEFGVEEHLPEGNQGAHGKKNWKPITGGRSTTRIYSEIIPQKMSRCYPSADSSEVINKTGLVTADNSLVGFDDLQDFNAKTEQLLKDLEREVYSISNEKNKVMTEIQELRKRKRTQEQSTVTDTGREALRKGASSVDLDRPTKINLKIRIGEHESENLYKSAMSVLSGRTDTSVLSLMDLRDGYLTPMTHCSVEEFVSASALPPLTNKKSSLTPSVRPAAISSPPESVRAVGDSIMSLAFKFKVPYPLKEESEHSISGQEVVTQVKTYDYPDVFYRRAPVDDGASDLSSRNEGDMDSVTFVPQMNVEWENTETVQKLRLRMGCLESEVRGLKMTIDRMEILTDKLSDDAVESSANFEDISKRLQSLIKVMKV